MARPRKKLTDEERQIKQLATFKVLGAQWEDFGELCESENLSASEVLVGFIESCIRSGELNMKKRTPNDPNLEKRVSELEWAIERLDKLVVKHGGKINALEMKAKETQTPPHPPKEYDLSRKIG